MIGFRALNDNPLDPIQGRWHAINEEIPDAVTRWSFFLAYVSNKTCTDGDLDNLSTAGLDLGFGRYKTKNQQDQEARIHANEKHCVHDFKMALLVIRKASKTAHRSKDSFSPEERRNLRLVLGGLARPATTVNRR